MKITQTGEPTIFEPIPRLRHRGLDLDDATRLLVGRLADAAMVELEKRLADRLDELRRPDRALTRTEAMERCGIKKSQWARLLKDGLVPAPHPHTGRYSEREIEEFVANRWTPAATSRGTR